MTADEALVNAMVAAPKFSNQAHVVRLSVGTRLAFGESINDHSKFHTAVVMPNEAAVALRDLLVANFPFATDTGPKN